MFNYILGVALIILTPLYFKIIRVNFSHNGNSSLKTGLVFLQQFLNEILDFSSVGLASET